MRDDFSQTTKDLLANRVGWKCSNPNCRKATRGAGMDKMNVINIGVASHITAASMGGPRYDENMTAQERKSYENGIWLCQSCSKLIDSDEVRYTVEKLKRWKEISERMAVFELEEKASEDTVIASNTGVLRTRDGSILKKSNGKNAVTNAEWREKLATIYEKLVDIVNQYPNSSPSDVLLFVDNAPHFSMESFDAVLTSLDYQIEDHKRQLNNVNINYERKIDAETQISNREYAKKKISEIRDAYYMAKDRYKLFCKSDKAVFDLYAGQDVRNCLVEFEVILHNVFISGHSVGVDNDPLKNSIEIIRRKIINSMRKDIGTF